MRHFFFKTFIHDNSLTTENMNPLAVQNKRKLTSQQSI